MWRVVKKKVESKEEVRRSIKRVRKMQLKSKEWVREKQWKINRNLREEWNKREWGSYTEESNPMNRVPLSLPLYLLMKVNNIQDILHLIQHQCDSTPL